jgi:Na+/H+-dicarboxylate symporter
MKGNRLTYYIIGAMMLGIVIGYAVHTNGSPDFLASFSKNIKLLSTIFIRLGANDYCAACLYHAGSRHC